jgi:Ca2+/H+ antiporter
MTSMQRSALRPENTLSVRLLRREALRLAVVAVATAAALLFQSRVVSLIAAVADVVAALLAAVAGIVAWRVGGRTGAVLLYLAAVVVFAILALLNLQH